MPQLHGMPAHGKRVRNFHVPLPDDLYRRLRAVAARTGLPATEIAREAIRGALKRQQQAELRESIRRYATAMAGTSYDLDEELESAGLEVLLAGDRNETR